MYSFLYQLIQHSQPDGWPEGFVQNSWPTWQRHQLHLHWQRNQRWVLPRVHEQRPIIWRGQEHTHGKKDTKSHMHECMQFFILFYFFMLTHILYVKYINKTSCCCCPKTLREFNSPYCLTVKDPPWFAFFIQGYTT